MTNQEKEIKRLKKEVEFRDNQNKKMCEENAKLKSERNGLIEEVELLKQHLSDVEKEILALRDDLTAPLEIPIDLIFDVLPEGKAIQTISRLSENLKIRMEISLLESKAKAEELENQLEDFESLQSRIFKKS